MQCNAIMKLTSLMTTAVLPCTDGRNSATNPVVVRQCCKEKCLDLLCRRDIEELRCRLTAKSPRQQREVILEAMHVSKPSKDKGWIKAKFQIFVSILLNSVLLHSRIVATKLTMRHLLAPIHIRLFSPVNIHEQSAGKHMQT